MKSLIWFLTSLLMLSSLNVFATCYPVRAYESPSTPPASAANNLIYATEGVAVNWQHACDACYGQLGFPNIINARVSPFSPLWSVFAETTAPFTQYASNTTYSPETVFYRCAPEDPVYEIYIYSDVYGADAATAEIPGHPGLYAHRWSLVATRIVNLANSTNFSMTWQTRRLEGLDRDSRGYQLVKAKNMAAIRFEFYNSNTIGSGGGTNTQTISGGLPYNYGAAVAWVGIKGPGLTTQNIQAGDPQGNYGLTWTDWIGTITPTNQVTLMRMPSCKFLTVTPQVNFPNISAAELMAGNYAESTFTLTYECETGTGVVTGGAQDTPVITGTAAGNTALGFKVPDQVVAQSAALNLKAGTAATAGVTYLIPYNYGQLGVAEGVGIRIHRDGSPLNWLTSQDSARGSAYASGFGWYPLKGNSTVVGPSVNNVTPYSEVFQVRLERLPGRTVTSGSVYAMAQVIIQVQ